MTSEEIKEILELHKKWLSCEEGGERANLSEVDLHGVNLREADLSEANLCGADLHDTDLYGADLYGANLCGANLCGANLIRAGLHDADLHRADLCGADLNGAELFKANLWRADLVEANLCRANLSAAYLCEANLRRADLHRANLYGADLCEANLNGADLHGANLHGAKNLEKAINFLFPIRCPKTGSFTAYKKAVMGNLEFVIIQLTIPATAKRFSATGEKCRASQAKVEKFYDLDGNVIDIEQVFSLHDREFVYEIGKVVEPTEPFCEDRWNECASGIHFYMNFEEAVRF